MRPFILIVFACALGLSAAQSSGERQVRLDDIERDNLKSPQQTPQQRPSPLQYQAQYQHSPLIQYTPQYYPVHASPPSAPAAHTAQLFAQPSLTPGQLSSYHQQLIYSQAQQPLLIPQHQSLPFPVMLIPSSYLLPQDVNSILYSGLPQGLVHQAKYAPAQAQQLQQAPAKGFRPSPQINPPQYSPQQQYQQPQYNAYQTVYQQKYASGVKSTVAPPLKDNYVGQSNNYAAYKIQ